MNGFIFLAIWFISAMMAFSVLPKLDRIIRALERLAAAADDEKEEP